jgi:hypothetical protein
MFMGRVVAVRRVLAGCARCAGAGRAANGAFVPASHVLKVPFRTFNVPKGTFGTSLIFRSRTAFGERAQRAPPIER